MDGRAERLAQRVPEREVDGADRDHPEPLAAPGHRPAVHELPRLLDLDDGAAAHERREPRLHDRGQQVGREGGVADPDDPGRRLDLDDEPPRKCEPTLVPGRSQPRNGFAYRTPAPSVGASKSRHRMSVTTPAG